MARKIPLREFHEQVIKKLEAAAGSDAARASKLAVEIEGENWLVDLASISEVIPLPNHIPVPLTHGWFRGVVNVRGNLYGVTDFSMFLGRGRTALAPDNRVLLIHPKYGINAGLLVRRVFGLRNPEQLQPAEPAPEPAPWVVAEYNAQDGSRWKELDMDRLARHPDFLNIAVHRRVDVLTGTAQEPAGNPMRQQAETQ
jgi:twitching motility protein PilI